MSGLLAFFSNPFVIAALPFAITGLIWGTKYGFTALDGLSAKIKNDKIRMAVQLVSHFAETIVVDIENQEHDAIAGDAKDGKLPDGEGAKLKQIAMDRLHAVLGDEGKQLLMDLLGVGAGGIHHYLSGSIEKAVAQVSAKAAGEAAKPSDAPVASSPK